jgi:hypothetical protein
MKVLLQSERLQRWATALGLTVTGLAMAHLLLHFSSYIYKFHATSLFQNTWVWFVELFEKPAALLLYAGRFLTQFCYYPVLAVILLLALYALITWLTYRWLLRDTRIPFLAVLPALALFISLMRIGYGVVAFRADALVFTEPLGILGALLVWRLLMALPMKSRWPYAAIPLAALLGYPLLGCYALLGLLLYAVSLLAHARGQMRWSLPLACVLSIVLVPWIEYRTLYQHSVLRYMWFQGAPFLDYVGSPWEWTPLVLSGACLLAFALYRPGKRPSLLWHSIATVVLCGGVVTSIYLLPYRDSLFHRQMDAERAIEHGDWSEVAQRTLSPAVTNDVLIAYRNCALYALGSLSSRCMNYSFQTVPIVLGGREYTSSIIAGPTIFFYSGLINYAARISSEISLYTNYAVERWKFLAKAAVFNGERELAEKYLGTLEHTTFHKGWARRYRTYLDHPDLLEQDPEYKLIHPLQDYDEPSWRPSDNAATNVLMFYYYVPGRSPEMQEWNRAARRMVTY